MNTATLHLTHVLVTALWVIGYLSSLAVLGYYHIVINIWVDIYALSFTIANS